MEVAQVSISRWVDKTTIGHLHKEYYSAVKKKKEILLFMTVWMGPENIMLSEINQRKTNTIWSHSYVESNEQTELTRKMGTDP